MVRLQPGTSAVWAIASYAGPELQIVRHLSLRVTFRVVCIGLLTLAKLMEITMNATLDSNGDASRSRFAQDGFYLSDMPGYLRWCGPCSDECPQVEQQSAGAGVPCGSRVAEAVAESLDNWRGRWRGGG